MTITADIVVAGAGHNALITAAYLAKAGYECVLVDARPIPGGGAATEEILGDGYLIDTCSTGHTIIRTNPVLSNDELGLHSRYGLRYEQPDPVGHVAFEDGEQFTQWLDLDQTCDEIARFSDHDAHAYRRLIEEYDDIKGVFSQARLTPPGFGPSLEDLLRDHPRGGIWLRRAAITAAEVLRRDFESPYTQGFLAWQAFQTLVPLDVAGSGINVWSILFGRQRNSWSIPLGGSGSLTDALVRFLEDHGSAVHCNRVVSSLVLDNGRCVGVETEDGERFLARQAVVSSIHVKHLVDMAPADAWGEEFTYGVDTYDVGLSGMAAYYATTKPPVFSTSQGDRSAVSAGTIRSLQEVIDLGRAARDRRPWTGHPVPWTLIATPTLVDPQRAPDGHHTVKVLTPQVYELPDGVTSWEQHKETLARQQLEYIGQFIPDLNEDNILQRYVKSPDDIAAGNRHMIRGAFHGGDRSYAFSGPRRPVPKYASHRMPIEGLYQTGATTSVGGSITGVPGRNAAKVLLTDLGRDPEEVFQPL